MYNILIKYNESKNLWQLYGTTINATSGCETFTPFETDDMGVLKEEVVKLDAMYGHENIMVVKIIDYTVDIVISDDDKNKEE